MLENSKKSKEFTSWTTSRASYGLLRSMYSNSKKTHKMSIHVKKSSYHLCKNNTSAAFDFLFLSLHYFMVIFDTSGSFRPLKNYLLLRFNVPTSVESVLHVILFGKNNLNGVHEFFIWLLESIFLFFWAWFPLAIDFLLNS